MCRAYLNFLPTIWGRYYYTHFTEAAALGPSQVPLGPNCQLPVGYGEGQDCWGHYGRGLAQAEPQAALQETQTAQPVALGTHHSWRSRERPRQEQSVLASPWGLGTSEGIRSSHQYWGMDSLPSVTGGSSGGVMKTVSSLPDSSSSSTKGVGSGFSCSGWT